LIKYFVFTGPESTGKTTLANATALEYTLPCIDECARVYLDNINRPYMQFDLDEIAKGQSEAEQIYAEYPIICDTDLITVYIWKQVVYGVTDLKMAEIISSYKDDRFYFLCSPDIPWEYDPQRENPENRDELFSLYEQTLNEFDLSYAIIMGQEKEMRMSVIKQIMNMKLKN
jgi:nicotinamide riboside kinase